MQGRQTTPEVYAKHPPDKINISHGKWPVKHPVNEDNS